MQVLRIKNVQAYIEWVENLNGRSLIYRGLADKEWGLDSYAYRLADGKTLAFVKEKLQQAKIKGFQYDSQREQFDLEILARLQHQGSATCLIDFTFQPLVALWFACKDHDKKDGKVVATNSHDTAIISEIDYERLKKDIDQLLKEFFLWKWQPSHLNERIIAQNSIFLFSHENSRKINEGDIEIIHIASAMKKEIRNSLKEKYGIDEEFLYPDFDGFSHLNLKEKSKSEYDITTLFSNCNLEEKYPDCNLAKLISKCISNEKESDSDKEEKLIDNGVKFHQYGNFVDAIQNYDEAIMLNTGNPDSYYNRGNAYLYLANASKDKQDFISAIQDFNKAIDLGKGNTSVFFHRAVANQVLGSNENAISDFETAIELNPNNFAASNQLAELKSLNNDYQGCINIFTDIITRDSKNVVAYTNRGKAYTSKREYLKAINDYDKAIKLNYQDSNVYESRAIVKLKQYLSLRVTNDKIKSTNPEPMNVFARDRFAEYENAKDKYLVNEAIQDLDRAIKLDPKNESAYKNRGNLRIDLRMYSAAIQDLDKFLAMNTEDSNAYFFRGYARMNSGQVKRAIKDFDESINLNQNNVHAYESRASANCSLGKYTKAIKDYDKVISIVVDCEACYCERGLCKMELRRIIPAIQDYDKAIKLNPRYTAAYINRGIAKQNLGLINEAIKNYDQAIKSNPQYALAYYNRALAKQKLGQPQDAINDYDHAIEINPDFFGAYNNRGSAKYELGQPQDAINDYNKAIELNPNYADAYNNRGRANKMLEQHHAAKIDFNKAAKLDPDNYPLIDR